MEPLGSLSCLQDTTAVPCPESDESTPHPHILFLQQYFQLILMYFVNCNWLDTLSQ